MCIICRNEYNEDLTILNCSYCPKLTSLALHPPDPEGSSLLENLTTLNCSYCPKLTTIPLLEN